MFSHWKRSQAGTQPDAVHHFTLAVHRLRVIDLQAQRRTDLAEVEEKIVVLEVQLEAARSQLKEHASEEAALKPQLLNCERKQQVATRAAGWIP